jgi:energy-coupling factor transporter ATP-binding protein EcfA2
MIIRIRPEGIDLPPFEFEFARINVILGVNGVGKSRLLRHVVQRHEGKYPGTGAGTNPYWPGFEGFAFVEGQRVIQLDRVVSGATLPAMYGSGNRTAVGERLRNYLGVLIDQDARTRRENLDALEAWRDSDRSSPPPPKPTSRVREFLATFTDIFAGMALRWDTGAEVRVEKGAVTYSTADLSDGEKQILGLLTDSHAAPERTVFCVDEPELHLHARLAESFWSTMELKRPKSVFIYATHSIGFAMRSSVERIYVLGAAPRPTVRLINDPLLLPRGELRELLGALPAIMSSESALAVEGQRDISFDERFYRWVLGEHAVDVIVPLDSGNDVRNAVEKRGLWRELAPTVRMVGVIDRDYGTGESDSIRLVVLPYHEAESYLCDPALLHDLAAHVKSVDPIPSEKEITKVIVEWCAGRIDRVARERALRRGSLRVGISVPERHAAKLTSAGVKELIQNDARREADKVLERGDEVAAAYDRELLACRAAVETGDVSTLLTLFEGKELLRELAKLLGFQNEYVLLTAVVGNLQPTYAPIAELRRLVVAALDAAPDSTRVNGQARAPTNS